jgi:hypothetical protein
MALEGTGRYTRPERSRCLLYISTKVTDDSQFPFRRGQDVLVRIEGDHLVVEPMPDPVPPELQSQTESEETA